MTSSRQRRSEGARRRVRFPGWPEPCFGYSCASAVRRKVISAVTASGMDEGSPSRFSGRPDETGAWPTISWRPRGFRPQLLIDAASAIPRL